MLNTCITLSSNLMHILDGLSTCSGVYFIKKFEQKSLDCEGMVELWSSGCDPGRCEVILNVMNRQDPLIVPVACGKDTPINL
jgi:hypothetical protein